MGMDRDLVSGIFLVILGIAGFAGAETIENMLVTRLSGAFFPQVLFAIIILCGAALIFAGYKRTDKEALPDFKWGKLGQIVAALGIYVAIMEYAGFLISSVLFLVSAMLMFGERRIKVIIPAAVISSAVIYFLFTEAFMIVLPGIPGMN